MFKEIPVAMQHALAIEVDDTYAEARIR